MPTKNRVKIYQTDGYYHIYNRGVEKRDIFMDAKDYAVFLSYLKEYLEPKKEFELKAKLAASSYQAKDKIIKSLQMNNFSDEIDLLAFCLMPNHFHLLVKQKSNRGIESFMKSLSTRYVVYFNKRNNRVGGLFQGVYKAVLVNTDEQLFHLSRYIHQNPSAADKISSCPYSSVSAYLGKKKIKWLKPNDILEFFSKENKSLSYEKFISLLPNDINVSLISDLTID